MQESNTHKIIATPISRADCNAFVDQIHRHHQHAVGDKFRVACAICGELVGVVQVGRPASRELDDGYTVEVTRMCCKDGYKNVCSFLYSRAARIAKEMGYRKIITYILCFESGTSLAAAGWKKVGMTRGGNWDTPSRRRSTSAPTCKKARYEMMLQEAINADPS